MRLYPSSWPTLLLLRESFEDKKIYNSLFSIIQALQQYFQLTTSIFNYDMRFRGARVVRGSVLSIPDSVDTVIAWSSADFDTDAIWNSSDTFTIPANSLLGVLHLSVQWDISASGDRTISIVRNGVDIMAISEILGSAGANQYISTGPISIAGGDTFQTIANQTSGGALNIINAENTFFSLEIVDFD